MEKHHVLDLLATTGNALARIKGIEVGDLAATIRPVSTGFEAVFIGKEALIIRAAGIVSQEGLEEIRNQPTGTLVVSNGDAFSDEPPVIPLVLVELTGPGGDA